jgi:hypothetical protein
MTDAYFQASDICSLITDADADADALFTLH